MSLAAFIDMMRGFTDTCQKPAYADRLATEIPDAQLVWIKGAGYWLMRPNRHFSVGFMRNWCTSAMGTLPEVTKVRITAAKTVLALPCDQPKVGLPLSTRSPSWKTPQTTNNTHLGTRV